MLSANYVVLLIVDINNEMAADPAVNVIGPALNNASTNDIQKALNKADNYAGMKYTEVTVNVPAEGMSVAGLSVPAGMTLTFTGADTVKMTGAWTVDGTVTLEGALDLNSQTLQGSGTVTGDKVYLGSSIGGTVKVTFKSAVLKGSFTVSGGTLTVNGAITSADDKAYTITITGGVVSVTGDVKGNLNISGDAAVKTGSVTGNVTNNGTGTVDVGTVTGTVDGSGNTTYKIDKDAVAYIVNK